MARQGGDKFVVLANGLRSATQARDLGNQLLGLFEARITLKQQQVRIGLTIGYAMAPLDGKEASLMLKLTDAAMYEGKRSGKRCLRRHNST